MAMIWHCTDCEETFDEPDTYEECMGEFWGAPAYETFSCCPYCNSTEIEEIDEDDEGEDYND